MAVGHFHASYNTAYQYFLENKIKLIQQAILMMELKAKLNELGVPKEGVAVTDSCQPVQQIMVELKGVLTYCLHCDQDE